MNRSSIDAWTRERDYAWAAGGLETLSLVNERLQRRLASGELDPAFHREWLSSFTYLQNCTLDRPRSVLVVAVPSPAYSLSFDLGVCVRKLIIPPTYVRFRPIIAAVCAGLNAAVDPRIPHFEPLNAPMKSLGAVLGLVRYGRNNIAYAPPHGSYVQLAGLVSDLDLADEDAAPPPREWPILEACRTCDRCAAACTRGAIVPVRFLLYAERCVVIATETEGVLEHGMAHPSPACAIGCLRCQQVCPENAGRLAVRESGAAFTAEETAFILRHGALPAHPLAESIRAKFDPLGMTEPPELFVRNAKFLLSRASKN